MRDRSETVSSLRLTRDGRYRLDNVIDTETLRKEIEQAVDRFAGDAARLWWEARRRHFLDLRADPRPWWSPVRAANTNGSILLDRYACLVTPEVVEELGFELSIALIVVGVVTEDSGVFGPRS